jgi:hypothetical protein
MFAFRPNVRITDIAGSITENGDLVLQMRFNTEDHLFLLPKSALDLFYMLNGQFSIWNIIAGSTDPEKAISGIIRHLDISPKETLQLFDEFIKRNIVYEFFPDEKINDRYIHAPSTLSKYIAHFPKMSNINITIAIVLQKIGVKSIFYDNNVITENDVNANIYFKSGDTGKNIIPLIQDKMKIGTVFYVDTDFNIKQLNKNTNIIVNSDSTDWIDAENHIVINTWNYRNARFEDFKLFNGKASKTAIPMQSSAFLSK